MAMRHWLLAAALGATGLAAIWLGAQLVPLSPRRAAPPQAALHAPQPPGAPAAGQAPGAVQLVAVQMRWRVEDYATAEAFARRVDAIMREAAARLDRRYPALVVFPEDVGILTALVGEADAVSGAETLQEAVARVVRRHLPDVLWQRARHGVSWPRAVFLARADTMARTYLETFSAAARRYGVYVVAGSIPLPDFALPPDGSLPRSFRSRGGGVFNTSFLFGPDGRIVGRQRKVHLIDLEGPEGLDIAPAPAESLAVFDTAAGRVGIAICLDAFKPDVLQRLAAQGAQILVQPSANPAAWTREQQLDWLNGSWRATVVEGRFAYAVNPMMVGDVLNLGFAGQSAIIARQGAASLYRDGAGRSPGRIGVLARTDADLGYADAGPRQGFVEVAKSAEREEVLVVRVIHPDRLPAAR